MGFVIPAFSSETNVLYNYFDTADFFPHPFVNLCEGQIGLSGISFGLNEEKTNVQGTILFQT